MHEYTERYMHTRTDIHMTKMFIDKEMYVDDIYMGYSISNLWPKTSCEITAYIRPIIISILSENQPQPMVFFFV